MIIMTHPLYFHIFRFGNEYFYVFYFLLQVLLEPCGYLAKQVITGITSEDTMVTVGVPKFLEVLVSLHECL